MNNLEHYLLNHLKVLEEKGFYGKIEHDFLKDHIKLTLKKGKYSINQLINPYLYDEYLILSVLRNMMDSLDKMILKNEQIIAVDFDGTLCSYNYPGIGSPNYNLIEDLIKLKKNRAAKLILWTCRTGESLKEAVDWCERCGLVFDAVNENLPEIIDRFGGDSRKIYADLYIDDKNDRTINYQFSQNLQVL